MEPGSFRFLSTNQSCELKKTARLTELTRTVLELSCHKLLEYRLDSIGNDGGAPTPEVIVI